MNDLEKSLSSLLPAPGRFNRDRILFRAGQNSAPRRWLWPCLSAGLAMLSAGLLTMLVMRPGPVVEERIVYLSLEVPAPPVTPPTESPEIATAPPESSWRQGPRYYQVQEQVLRWGLDGLPEPAPLAPLPLPPREHLLDRD
jgi:hypothetical protein